MGSRLFHGVAALLPFPGIVEHTTVASVVGEEALGAADKLLW